MPKVPRGNIGWADLNTIVQRMIAGKNDREIGILAGAFLEGLLHDLLKATVVNSPFQRADTLFDYPKPLSSFGNLISLAFAFGLISEIEYNDLRIVKRVRDLCAHSLSLSDDDALTFGCPAVRGILRDFNPRFAVNACPKELRDKIAGDFERCLDFDNGKLAFRIIFCEAAICLFARIQITPPLQSPPDINEENESSLQNEVA